MNISNKMKKRLQQTLMPLLYRVDGVRKNALELLHRQDSEPSDWITIEKRQIPLDENGEPMNGEVTLYGEAKHETLFLPKDEYARVCSAISTEYNRVFKKYSGKSCGVRVRNMYYLFDNEKFGYYNIFDKFEIVGNEIWIDRMEALWKD